ncbi:phytanoyl-CoA dioxygenase family protein [Myxococcota bacterium]|nr:phytanoyl-CoA dioxygenase family protein [Myxococcota bacterium]
MDSSSQSRDALDARALAECIRETGFVILEDAIAPEFVTDLISVIDRLHDDLGTPFGTNEFLGERSRRIFNLLTRDPLFRHVPTHPAVLSVAQAVLDPECLLSSLTAIEMNPGETAQPLHADDGSYRIPKPHPAYNCIAIWALTDFTPENGGTLVVPGSHLRERGPSRSESVPTESITMRAGSVVVYHGSLWHGGGANLTEQRRMGIVCNYCAGFLRQEESQLLAIPPEQVAEFTPELRKLVGYGTYRGLLGHVDQRDPASLVDPDVETDMVWRRIRK